MKRGGFSQANGFFDQKMSKNAKNPDFDIELRVFLRKKSQKIEKNRKKSVFLTLKTCFFTLRSS